MRPPSSDFHLAEQALLRFNWVPSLTSEGQHLEEVRDASDRVLDLTLAIETFRTDVAAHLSELAPQVDPTERGAVLSARREIFKGRNPKSPVPAVVARYQAVAAWMGLHRQLTSATDALSETLSTATGEERQQLAGACTTPELLRALSSTSSSLSEEARRYAARGAPPAEAKLSKSEAAIIRYLDRARLRTSPFSWYTSTALLELGGDGPALPDLGALGGAVAHVEAGHAVLRRIVDALVRHDEVRRLLSYTVAERSAADEEKLTFNVIVDGLHPRVYGNTDQDVSVRRTRALEGLLEWLGAQERAVPWPDLCEVVQSWGGNITAEVAKGFLGQLIDVGVLKPALPLPEQAPDLLERTVALMRSLDVDVARRAADALDGVRDALAQLAGADIDARPSTVVAVEQRFAEALEAVGLPPTTQALYYETTVVPSAVPVGSDAWRDVASDANDAVSLLEAFDRTRTLRTVLREEFVAQFGVGGRCKDMVAFRDLIARSLERWGLAVIGADPIDQVDPELASANALRRELLIEYIAYGRAGREELAISKEWLDAAKTRVWPSGHRPWSSYSVFLQPEVDEAGTVRRAVVNNLYTGIGMYVSRFLPFVEERCRDAVRRRLHALVPGEHVLAEIRPTCGFNANLHPLLADVDIDVDGRPQLPPAEPGQAETWRPDRLHVAHDAESGEVELIDSETDRVVDVLYLGLLIPFLLPTTWAALYVLAARGPVIDPFDAPSEATRLVTENGKIRSYPRVTVGRVVVERRRWYVPATMLQEVVGDARDAELVLRLRRWARDNGIPDAVFVRPKSTFEVEPSSVLEQIARQAPWSREKPQYLNLCSPLRVAAFAKVVKRAEGDIVIEEALPVPGSAPITGPHGQYVAEVVLELDRAAHTERAVDPPSGDHHG